MIEKIMNKLRTLIYGPEAGAIAADGQRRRIERDIQRRNVIISRFETRFNVATQKTKRTPGAQGDGREGREDTRT